VRADIAGGIVVGMVLMSLVRQVICSFGGKKIAVAIGLGAALSSGLFLMNARAEDPGNSADKARFEALSQHGNAECSVQFEKLIATMPADDRLQGSCCAPMDEARYRRQLEGLKNYADIAEVPPDPYDISARLAHTLMGYYTLALNKNEQAAYDYAMQHSDIQGPCCCKCWRWKVYGGLGKHLIRTRHYTGQQVTDLWNVGQGCGGPADTKMH
jgi:hypothetical protein